MLMELKTTNGLTWKQGGKKKKIFYTLLFISFKCLVGCWDSSASYTLYSLMHKCTLWWSGKHYQKKIIIIFKNPSHFFCLSWSINRIFLQWLELACSQSLQIMWFEAFQLLHYFLLSCRFAKLSSRRRVRMFFPPQTNRIFMNTKFFLL